MPQAPQVSTDAADAIIAELWKSHYDPVNVLRAKHGQTPRSYLTAQQLKDAPWFDRYNQLSLKGHKTSSSEDDGSVSRVTDKLEGSDLVRSQIETERAKLAGVQTDRNKGRHWWDDIAENVGSFGDTALHGVGAALGTGLDVVSRPLYGVTSGISELIDPQLEGGSIYENVMKRAAGATFKKEKVETTGDILRKPELLGGMSGGWQKSALISGGGLVGDVVLDPFTYVSGGTTAVGKAAALKGVAALGEHAPTIAKAIETGIQMTERGGTVAKGVKSLTSAEAKTLAMKVTRQQVTKKSIQKQVVRQVEEEARDLFVKTGHAMPYAQRAERMKNLSLDLTDEVRNAVEKGIIQGNKRRFAVRVAGKDVLGGKIGSKIGRAAYVPFQYAGAGANKLYPVRALKHAFQIGDHFPGMTNRLRRLAESYGIRQHEIFSKKVDNLVKGVSKDGRKQVLKDLERGVRSEGMDGGKDLGEIYDWFDNYRKEKFLDLEDTGIYEANKQAANYVPVYMRSGSKDAIKTWKKGRKTALRNGNVTQLTEHTLEAAKGQGFKPYDLVDDAFKMYDADVGRKIIRRNYHLSLLDNYGIRASKDAAEGFKKRGFVDASEFMKPADREALGQLGEGMYMHPEIKNTAKKINKMLESGNHEDLNRLMRMADRFTNWYKRTATVYSPRNWVNNTFGDMIMNFFDGVQNPIWYKKAAKVLRDTTGTIRIGGQEVDKKLLKELYDRYSSGAGFLRADVNSDLTGRLGKWAGRGFQHREDFGRAAHFLHALDSELKSRGTLKEVVGFLKKNPSMEDLGLSTVGKRLQDAATAAGERVSKWNIDYSAFTPFERNYLKKIIPFYAWQRKSIPLIAEAMVTKPGRVSAVRKTQSAVDQLFGGGQPNEDGQYKVEYPWWLRDAAFMRIGGTDKEPMVLQDNTPLAQWKQTFGQQSFTDFIRNQAASLHPAIRAPFELGSKRELLTNREFKTIPEYLSHQIPLSNQVGIATGVNLRGKEQTNAERIASLLGGDITNVTDKVQSSELQRQKDPLDVQLAQANKKLESLGYEVRKVKNGYKVVDLASGQQVGGNWNATTAYAMAWQMAGLKK